MKFAGEFAIKFALQTAPHYTTRDLVRLAQLAQANDFRQIWVNDNLGQRNIFVVLSAIAARVQTKIGTAIVVPYFRNPVDIAGSLAALSELTEKRGVSVGIARGEALRAGEQIVMPQPVTMVRETTLLIKALWSGETISFRDYPATAAYHHIRPEYRFRLGFSAAAPLRFYCGGHGPQILKIAGEIMDGIYFGDHYIPVARANKLERILSVGRSVAINRHDLFDICELDISIARDRSRALEFARPYAAHILLHLEAMGFTPDEFFCLGVEPRLIDYLKDAAVRGARAQDAARMVPDQAIRSCFITGTAEECHEQLVPLLQEAERLNFRQLAFAKLGPDCDEAITLLADILNR